MKIKQVYAYVKYVILFFLTIAVYGFFCPYLFSAKDDVLFICGFVLLFGYVLIALVVIRKDLN